jgi:large subunit ribosomal protein L3
MKFILGYKLNMTQVFDEAGAVHGVTVLKAGPMTVTQVKTKATDGYAAVQLGFGEQKKERLSKATRGHLKDLPSFRHLKEERVADDAAATALKVGDKIDLSVFKEGDMVTVSATSKGKGFQGVVKRHGFAGGPRTHGQKHSEREPGSIGGGLRNKVPKNMRMAGRMGADTITVRNLKVVKINPETSEIFIEGAIPGRRGSLVEVSGN